jgi:Xaa-Pro aminopeptidase
MGTALVGQDHSYLWTDGRYYNQASQELNKDEWTLMKIGLPETPTLERFVAQVIPSSAPSHPQTFPAEAKIAVDPRLVSISYVRDIRAALAAKNQSLELINENLVDQVWADRPDVKPERDVIILDDAATGKSVSDKLSWLREQLQSNNASLHVVTALDAIACIVFSFIYFIIF